jgi:hypothetical protein
VSLSPVAYRCDEYCRGCPHECHQSDSEAPTAPHTPEPTPVPGSTVPEPAHVHTAPPDMSSGPTDTPPKDSHLGWHASEAEALARLADLTTTRSPWAAAQHMWSS